ncbi:TPA: hypothetical protein L7J54_001174 [Klebsiella pneumoniae]|nr:hypothetical protein [Klebsiella pneumoniae]EKV7304008.1 hypothetical protein [Klebsiella pneumoniae]EKV8926045.1 hypothetical protein [Klebsiella pneumoniae]EKZ9939815.1 hypothetical protein [Klebsiella pneumoniae]ELA0311862.1 hypothetical protein [Klebsiella pneumoniae]ELA0719875.1 hypothetical protein [Klebsiella pneumoniae]
MTLQAVNELIASLESAGEPSIREQKFLKLAKAYQQLAAENAGLKAGIAEEIEVINRGGQAYCVKDGMSINPIYARGWNDHRANLAAEKTPATDRIVAGIKADGVEDMANLFFKLAKDEANSLIAEQWRESGRVANEQAKQLREGADK